MLIGAKNAICAPKGFVAAACASGLKKSGKLDLALVYSQVPAVACGTFTRNKFAACPVKICREHLKTGQAQAILVNSGNANCFTGKSGLEGARQTMRQTAGLLALKNNMVLVASTGVIGRQMDFKKIKRSLPALVSSLNREGGSKFARAIMTTDTKTKELQAKLNIGNNVIHIGAACKGAGMIAPDMATMLCFITTDARIQYAALNKVLKEAVESSFNMISIDGCMSTNDSVIILANGLAQNEVITLGSRNLLKFSAVLKEICLGLAKMIVQDAEGATKFITIKVSGAKDNLQARRAALQIANSNLFKTAVYGENPNFGRIVAAAGAAGVKVKDTLKINYTSLNKKNIEVKINLMVGHGYASAYTSDLTPDYIRINAGYN